MWKGNVNLSKNFTKNITKWVSKVDPSLEIEKVNISGGGSSRKTGMYVGINATIISVIKISLKHPDTNLYTEFLTGLKLLLNDFNIEMDYEQLLKKSFASIPSSEKIKFVKSIYKNANGMLKKSIMDMGKLKKRRSLPEKEKRDSRWWHQIIDVISSTMESLLLCEDNLYFDEIDVSNIVNNETDDMFKAVVDAFPQNELLVECMTELIRKYKAVFVEALSADEMKPVLVASLLKGQDVEVKMKSIWTNIKIQASISDNTFDDYVYTQLNFLNNLLGFRFISRAQVFAKYFRECTDHYVISELLNGNNASSMFCLEQSVDMDFENTGARHLMQVKQIGDVYFIAQFVYFDAYSKKVRSHPTNSICSRANGAYVSICQNNTILKTDILWTGDDKRPNQKDFLLPYYEASQDVENSYFDPISGAKLFLPFFYNADLPATIGSIGANSLTAKYGLPLVDGVSTEEMKSVENGPMRKIISCNKDKTSANNKYEKNVQKIIKKGRVPTEDEKKRAALDNKTSTRDEYFGTCMLYHWPGTWHLHLRFTERLFLHVSMLGMWLQDYTIADINQIVKELIGTIIDILLNPRNGSRPIVAIRGEIVKLLVPKFTEFIEMMIGDDVRIGPVIKEALLFMAECVVIINDIWTEYADLNSDEITVRCQMFEHYSINFIEHGKIIFGPDFETISLRMISDIASTWLKMSHILGYGMMNIAEGVGEKRHQDIAALTDMSTINDRGHKCQTCTLVLKRARFQQELAEQTNELNSKSITNLIYKKDQENLMPNPRFAECKPLPLPASYFGDPSEVKNIKYENTLNKGNNTSTTTRSARQIFPGGSDFFVLFSSRQFFEPSSLQFHDYTIIIPVSSQSRIQIDILDEVDKTWRFNIPWWNIRTVLITEILNLPLEITGWQDNVQADEDSNIILIDLLRSADFKAKSRKHQEELDPSRDKMSNASTFLFELKKDDATKFKERVLLETSSRNLDILTDDPKKCQARLDELSYSKRMSDRNKSKFNVYASKDPVAKQCIVVKPFRKFGAITYRLCKHEKCLHPHNLFLIGGTHSYCIPYINSKDVSCGHFKHDFFWKMLSSDISSHSLSSLDRLDAESLKVAQEILDYLKDVPMGLDLDWVIHFIIESDANTADIATRLSLKIIIDQDRRFVISKYYKSLYRDLENIAIDPSKVLTILNREIQNMETMI